MYGSDWPFVEREFVVDQLDELMTIPPFFGDAFSAMKNGNARRLFKRFGRGPRLGGCPR